MSDPSAAAAVPTPKFDRNAAQNALYAEFPHLFWTRELPEEPMRYGLTIGPGWFPIVRELCLRITRAIDQDDLKDPKATMWAFSQIKEKYGELRVYGPEDKEGGPISNAYEWAEEEASKTCEECGGEGSLLIIKGWYTTTCQQCAEKRKEEE
ncbi:hypothetical protein ABW20_dc0105343 [Dactylellina cionopaga]|nr:hypothetical protein ABW20_dc0105343 [Dactylellina cionopaga]